MMKNGPIRRALDRVVAANLALMAGCSSSASSSASDGGVPEGGVLGSAVPESGTLESGVPGSGLSESGAPEAGGTALGATCGSAGECGSGYCVDGVCCDSACSGQCESCSGATKGTCAPVTGTPVAPRASCTGTGACGGTCDGTSSDCTYPPSTTICGSSCNGTCDGAGNCSEGSTTSCAGGFACGSGGKCMATCTTNDNCQTNFTCDTTSGTCQRIPESNCLDGEDNNGDGLADCAYSTCTTVECVPAVGSGAEIGTVVDSTTCPVNFQGATPMYQTLTAGACTGCKCATECTAELTAYSNTVCGGDSNATQYFRSSGGTTSPCGAFDISEPYGIESIQLTELQRNGACDASGTPSQPAPAWGTTKYFCTPAKTSATCGANQVCVPKSTTTISAKVPSSGSCPSGYAGAQSTYYTSYAAGSCGSTCASCNASNSMNCGVLSGDVYSDKACTTQTGSTYGNSANTVSNCIELAAAGNYVSVESMKIGTWLNAATSPDTCTSNYDRTEPTPTGGQVVCNVQ